MSSIRNKLVAASAAVTLPPLVALGWYGGTTIEEALRTDGLSRLETRMDSLSAQIERYLAGTDGDLLLLADTPALAQYLLAIDSGQADLIEAARKNLSLAFVRLSEIRGTYHQIRFIDSTGSEKIRVDRVNDVTMVLSPDKLESKKSDPAFEEALKLPKGKLLVSPVELNREKGKLEDPHRPILRYSTAVYDANARRRGVLVIGVAVEPVLQLVSQSSQEGETLFLAGTDGAYLSHPQAGKAFGSDRDLASGEGVAKDYPELAAKLLATRERMKDEASDVVTLARPVSVPGVPGVNVGVLVDAMPTEILYATASGFRSLFNTLTFVALLLALAFGSLVAYFVTKPIIALTEAVDRMSRGDLDSPIETVSNDEVQTLAVAMERLRKSMQLMLDKYS